jgi:subtilisin family serine protease
MIRLAFVAAVVALAAPQPGAEAARYAVGARSADDLPALRRALGPGTESLAPLPAVVVERATPPRLRDLPGATYVERLAARRLAYVPTDPLAEKQWHLATDRAYDFWDALPLLPPVRVAVIDSGIDGDHPEFAGKIAEHASFVGGSALVDDEGHGTFVAGLIAAGVDNEIGVAGMAPSAELLIAKVVNSDNLIDVEDEVRAVRWAVRNKAQVINMSLGALRDPRHRERDGFSALEAAAVAYAQRHGALVVAAVGNSDNAPTTPWPFANYPAALPHVLGVSALGREGAIPVFSNRDRIYNDLAAPGVGVLSTFPVALTAEAKECKEQGYSSCGPDDYRKGDGTSFAAAQVSAAAAVLLAVRPTLRPEQVIGLLTRTARDVNAASGCRACPLRRDRLSGWGRLDVAEALGALGGDEIPPRDHFEPNDDAGAQAQRLWGPIKRIEATLDFWDDQSDVYAIKLRRGQPVYVSVRGPIGTDTNLILWKPGTQAVDDLDSLALRARQSARPGPHDYLAYRATKTGWHYVQVKLGSAGSGRYKLTIVKA